MHQMKISIAIPTLGRDDILVDTINSLLSLNKCPDEILIIDQSNYHNDNAVSHLSEWHRKGNIIWIKIRRKSITSAMNIGLRKATSERVLFLDDDIIPDKYLLDEHENLALRYSSSIIAGRVLQPWHHGVADTPGKSFLFNSLDEREVDTFMGGNVSIPRLEAIRIGGFDTNFIRVAYHFEAEFAYRWRANGNKIYYAPKALIHHLKTERGGTRSYGKHLTTLRPDHTVGRHYFYLCKYSPKKALFLSLQDIYRSIITKHHLRKPFWIPFTIISEMTGLFWANILISFGRGTIASPLPNLLVIASHPVQYYSPIYSLLDKSDMLKSIVLYLTVPDSRSQSLGFGHEFTWDVPLFNGYNYKIARKSSGKGLYAGFFGVRLQNPWEEIRCTKIINKPDAALITGWHFWGMVQAFICLKASNIPIILRMDSNSLRQRNFILTLIYRKFSSWVDVCLYVGKRNHDFYKKLGIGDERLIRSPHVVDNHFFHANSKLAMSNFYKLRAKWNIPEKSFCFLFSGKLQAKKRPLDLLIALGEAIILSSQQIHLLIVGTGPLEKECQQFSDINNLPVSFVGFLNQSVMPNAYAVSNCIVLPSDQGETWGLVINEAMACGLPAIVSDHVGCVPDLVFDGITGYSYKCGDVGELAKKIAYMANNIELAKDMGRNAQQLVYNDFSPDKVIESIESAVKLITA
jgi:glycosyltransferase involved in cell wall biosynthesis